MALTSDDTQLTRRILNAAPAPDLRYPAPQHLLSPYVEVMARVIFEDIGPVWIPGQAVSWTKDRQWVTIELQPHHELLEGRGGTVALPPGDVRRRGR